MRGRLLVVFLAVGSLSSLAGLTAPRELQARQTALPRYKASYLSPLPGFRVSAAKAINELGTVVGASGNHLFSPKRATWWDRRGRPTELPSDGEFNEALAINRAAEVAGWALFPEGGTHACVWKDGLQRFLPELPGAINSQANGINDAGWIVGECGTDKFTDEGFEDTHAVLWRGDEVLDLGTLGGSWSRALGINEKGQIVGAAAKEDESAAAFFWQDGVMTALPTPDAFVDAEAHDINDRGLMVGSSFGPRPMSAAMTLWQGETVSALPFWGYSPSVANDGTVVTSFVGDAENFFGFVWKNGERDWLRQAIFPRPRIGAWRNNAAWDVNRGGQIVGWTYRRANSKPIAFRLDPIRP
jgi:probable HAF family extracellular repeat protein